MSREAIDAERRARLTLERRLGELESRVRGMWVFPASIAETGYAQLYVGSGNTLATLDGVTYKGVKRASSVTSVPSATPSSISTSYSDGLTAAYNYGSNPNATSGPLAWLASCASLTVKNPAGSGSDVVISTLASPQMREGTLIASVSSYLVPVSGSPGAYARVYVPYLVSI